MCGGSKPKQSEPEKPELRVLLGRRQLEDMMIPMGSASQESGIHPMKQKHSEFGQSGVKRYIETSGLQIR